MTPTLMAAEAGEAPALVAAQLRANAPLLAALGERLRAQPPRAVLTLGRGSSDNAATYARYLIETRLGVVTASAPPSVDSVYGAAVDRRGDLLLVFSQSGRSPDLIAAASAAARGGALVVAFVNAPASPLAEVTEIAVPLRAGAERSVAATKTFIASLAAAAQLAALWSGEPAQRCRLEGLPALLERAWPIDWSPLRAALVNAQSLYVIGRGVGLAVAQEAALKFKETCALHAEAVSAAELAHGPMALVGRGFPVLAFVQDDETRASVEEAAAACAAAGAQVFQAGGSPAPGVIGLASPAAAAELEPIGQALAFYRLAESLARARGADPDHPPHLAKVTKTL